MTCPNCSYIYQHAPSKRVQLCPNCVHKERNGEYLTDVRRRKAKESMERSRQQSAKKQALKPKIEYKIPKLSEKGKQQAKEVSATKIKLKADAKDGDYTECQGCKKSVKQIQGSHKVPLSRSIALASEAENIRLLCGECHDAWEHLKLPEALDLRCFLEDMRYLFRVDNGRFWRLFQKVLDHHGKSPTQKSEMVISKIEKFTV